MSKNPRDLPVTRRHHRMLPVWFFVGALLLVYGIIILFTSIADLHKPTGVVLARHHAGIWGGVVLILLGGGYAIKYWPRKPR